MTFKAGDRVVIVNPSGFSGAVVAGEVGEVVTWPTTGHSGVDEATRVRFADGITIAVSTFRLALLESKP